MIANFIRGRWRGRYLHVGPFTSTLALVKVDRPVVNELVRISHIVPVVGMVNIKAYCTSKQTYTSARCSLIFSLRSSHDRHRAHAHTVEGVEGVGLNGFAASASFALAVSSSPKTVKAGGPPIM